MSGLRSNAIMAFEKDVENTPKKYRDIAAKDVKKMTIELDKIYAMYTKIRQYEEKVCKKFDINIDGCK